MQAPTPKVTSSMAVSETRRSASIWSLEKATASGYRLNCTRHTAKPSGSMASIGSDGSTASGRLASSSRMPALRISTARSWRSDSQPSGHCTSRPAKMQLPMKIPTSLVLSPWAAAYSGARP
ncbi:hypothetical protein D3C76_1515990 [compost metagenome]